MTEWAVLGLGLHTAGSDTAARFERALFEGTAEITGTVAAPDEAAGHAIQQAVGDAGDIPVLSVDRLGTALTDLGGRAAVLYAAGAFGAVAVSLAPGARPDALATLTTAGGTADLDLTPGAGGDLLAVLRGVFHLHHRHLPRVGTTTRPWCGPHRTALVRADRDVLLSATARPTRTGWHDVTPLALLPVCGHDVADLTRALTAARDSVVGGADVVDLAGRSADLMPAPALRAVLCVCPATVLRELDRALATAPAALAAGADWSSPAGGFCAAAPIGPGGGVALVFPGMFSSYAGGSRELLRCFPEAQAVFDTFHNGREGSAVESDLADLLDGHDADGLSIRLIAAVMTGTAHTAVLRGLLPGSRFGTLGYSLGEISMAAATGRRTWRSAELPPISELEKSFTPPDPQTWGSRVVLARPDDVRRLLPRFPDLHLTHVNTPEEVVIAGDPQRCRLLAEALGRPSLATARSHHFHTPLFDARCVAPLFRGNEAPGWDAEIFTGVSARPLPGPLRDDILDGLRRTLDFPRLVRAAHVHGYRYFIEVGAGGTAANWITATLGHRPHVAESLERRGAAGTVGMARVLARLISHGLPIDPTPFLPSHKDYS